MGSLEQLDATNALARLREKDASLFSADPGVQALVANRLGWIDLPRSSAKHAPALEQLAQALIAEGATDVLLLGMGGSSLAPLVMDRICDKAPDHPRLHVLDTTSPAQIASLLGALNPATTYAIVASKSGGTIEPNSLYAIVRAWLQSAGVSGTALGERFIAITDPGSSLERLAADDAFRATFLAPPTVGGRYSALTLFGLVPAAIAGIDLDHLLTFGNIGVALLGNPPVHNPAVRFAAFIVDSWKRGCDKLTIVTSARYRAFGLWIEQLVAESLGKDGVGVVPVIEHAPAAPGSYGKDRAFVVLRAPEDDALKAWMLEIANAHHPVIDGYLEPEMLAAEFVRWTHAVALAGALMGLNPFDELAVTEAKQATLAILGGAEHAPVPLGQVDCTDVTVVGYPAGTWERLPETRAEVLRTALADAEPGDYIAFLVYAPDDAELLAPLERACTALSHATRHAVCLELGPRYLHSTGQLHKGGANNGIFVLVTARDHVDLAIPGQEYTLGQLHRAQAEGDLVTLARHERRVVRLDIPSTSAGEIASLAADIEAAAGA